MLYDQQHSVLVLPLHTDPHVWVSYIPHVNTLEVSEREIKPFLKANWFLKYQDTLISF